MTCIGRSVSIRGNITSDEDLIIEGQVRGAIHVRDATVVVALEGRVDAEVHGALVQILGRVRGHVSATHRIELRSSAVVAGTLSANQVIIREGARFNGLVDMARRTIALKVAQFKADQAATR